MPRMVYVGLSWEIRAVLGAFKLIESTILSPGMASSGIIPERPAGCGEAESKMFMVAAN